MKDFGRTGATAVLLLSLAASLPAAEPDRYLPADAQWVAALDVRQFMKAPLVQQHFAPALRQGLITQPGIQEVLRALPIDLFADVDLATLAAPLPLRAERGVLILHGQFDLTKVHTAAEQYARQEPRAFQIQSEANRPLYQFTDLSKTGVAVWASFPDKNTLLLTPSRKQLTELLTRKADDSLVIGKELRTLLAGVDGKQTFWLAGLASPELKKELSTSPETEKLFQSLQHLSGGLSLADGVQLSFVLQTNVTAVASELRKFLEGAQAILSLAAMDSKVNAHLLGSLVAAIKLGNVKEAVVIRAAVTKEQIEKLSQQRK